MTPLETELYHVLNYFPHGLWAWMLILFLAWRGK